MLGERGRSDYGPYMHLARGPVAVCYYGGLALLLALILTGNLDTVLPRGLARKIGENSEGLLLALLLPAWLQAVRPRLAGVAARTVPLVVGLLSLAVGVWLYRSTTVMSSVKTLNETFLALAVLLPYVQRRRPMPSGLVAGCVGGVLAVMLLADRVTLVTRLAEALGMLLLVPLGLDLVDRGILQPGVATALRRRLCWYALLLLVPTAIALLHWADLGGPVGATVDYAERMQEAFVGVLLIEVYLAVGLGLAGRVKPPTEPAATLRAGSL